MKVADFEKFPFSYDKNPFLYTALIAERTLPIGHANGIVKKKSILARVVNMKPTMLATALLDFVPFLF